MVQPHDIAEVLGGERTLGRAVHGLHDLKQAVSEGLPFAAIERAFSKISPQGQKEEIRLLAQVVFRGTPGKRYDDLRAESPRSGEEEVRVAPLESERAERIARVFALALMAFDDGVEAREFLFLPLERLGGASPIENLETELGAKEVEQVLNSLVHGLPY